MCCLYYIEPTTEIRPLIEEAGRSPLLSRMNAGLHKKLVTEGEVRPMDAAPVIATSRAGSVKVFPMLWGFHLPASSALLMNARVETASSKVTFRDSWRQRRCIIPASWYFEWEHVLDPATGKRKSGQKYRIRPRSSTAVYLAGLYRMEEVKGISVPVFTVLTREPGNSIRFIHDRMPVLLPFDLIAEWLAASGDPESIAGEALTNCEYEKVL